MQVHHYLVYLMQFAKAGIMHYYVGATGVLQGQDDQTAVKMRKRWHLQKPVAWFRGGDGDSLSYSILATRLSKRAALMEEARETANLMKSNDEEGKTRVRGGPWCRCQLPTMDHAEIDQVHACTSREGVANLADRLAGGSLDKHLKGQSYAKSAVIALEAGASDFALSTSRQKPPMALQTRPRQSGRYRKGVQRASGAHQPLIKRPSSGKSGTNLSGACRRFHKLPLPPGPSPGT